MKKKSARLLICLLLAITLVSSSLFTACGYYELIAYPQQKESFIEKAQSNITSLIDGIERAVAIEEKKEEEARSRAEMESLYYYNSLKVFRYKAFKDANPDIPIEDVVWMVNVGLDQKYYMYTEEAADYDSLTVLVNKHISLPADYVPADIVYVDRVAMRRDVVEDYKRLLRDSEAAGLKIEGLSGFRDYEGQKKLYDRDVEQRGIEMADAFSARPGFSEHQTGLTVDLDTGYEMIKFSGSPEAAWVRAYGHLYGFIVRYTPENEAITGYRSEPWHVRYIGVEHATKMHELGINSFEEYKVKYIDYSPE